MAFYSEPIEVQCAGEPLVPVSFMWRDAEYRVQAILSSWQDFRFPGGAPRRKTWRLRHHRNYYVVRTEDGRQFELYLDRKGPVLAWVLYREVER